MKDISHLTEQYISKTSSSLTLHEEYISLISRLGEELRYTRKVTVHRDFFFHKKTVRSEGNFVKKPSWTQYSTTARGSLLKMILASYEELLRNIGAKAVRPYPGNFVRPGIGGKPMAN